MSYLTWISDKDLKAAVKKMAESVISARQKAENDISRNVIDPFSLFFNISLMSKDVCTWETNEVTRQAEKGLTNAMGHFHQEIISRVEGWFDPLNAQDFDLINRDKRIIVEMKNKYNTLNAEGQKNCFLKLHSAVNKKNSSFYNYTAYCVNIVPKQVGVSTFRVKDNASDTYLENDKVKLIDGHSFYALATGSETALHDLLVKLPTVLHDLKLAQINANSMAYIEKVFNETYSTKR